MGVLSGARWLPPSLAVFWARFVGRCRSPCGGGACLGRDRYPGGPWGAVEVAWPSAGRMPASLGRWVAALGALCFAQLVSRGRGSLRSAGTSVGLTRCCPLTARGVLTACAPWGTDSDGASLTRALLKSLGTDSDVARAQLAADGLCALGY